MDHPLSMQQNAEQTYHSIRQPIVSAQHQLSSAVNTAMVTAHAAFLIDNGDNGRGQVIHLLESFLYK